ncbi:MAG TPA: putative Ig domain-containing protein [Bryobacteraceae bacterium]|nr:putative Ig domain-containing protein [Bryobacteraceae bacterium]
MTDAANQSATRDLQITIAAGAPTITTTSLVSGTVGQPYSATLSATGGTPPYNWAVSAGALPAGLTLASNGAIAGTPTTAGTSTFTARVTDAANRSATRDLQITITAGAPTITTSSLSGGTVGQPYSASLAAGGGTPPYAWAVSAGSLPAGLTLASNGAITGTPTTAGASSFTARVTDAANQSATRDLQITITAPPAPTVVTTSLSGGTVGQGYSASLSATGGTPPYSWSVSAGSLPAGLTLASNGSISGTPTTAGTSTFTARVTDAANQSATRSLQIAIAAAPTPPTVVTTSLPNATVGVEFAQTLSATGGRAPYSWSVASGAIPPGLSLDPAGRLAGVPSNAGSYSFTIRVTDADSRTGERPFTMSVAPALSISSCPTGTGLVGTNYQASLAAAGGAAPYSWSVTSGQLPPGLTLSPAGSLSGNPILAGAFNFTLNVSDASSRTATRACSIAIASPLLIQTEALPDATTTARYFFTLRATGGTAPYLWTTSGGALPPGIFLDPNTGTLSGQPTQAGPYTAALRVTDGSGGAASRTYTIAVVTGLAIPSCPTVIATVGRPYDATVTALGGQAPYTWGVSSGSLPTGLTIASDSGIVSGVPASAGSATFALRVSDQSGASAERACSIQVAPELVITTSSLPPAQVGTPYTAPLTATGGVPPLTWSITGGALPSGLTLNSATGQISGTASAAGIFRITVQVSDSAGNQRERQLELTVGAGFTITACPDPSAVIGAPYSSSPSIVGGDAPVTWAIVTGSLPGGLTLDGQTGSIAGTATTAGTTDFSLRATDAASRTATRACSINVNPSALRISSNGRLRDAILGTAFSETLQVSGGRGPFTWSLAAGSLPPGVVLGSNGQLTGTPTVAGVYSFTARVTDADRSAATAALELRVIPAPSPTVSFGDLPDIIAPAQQPRVRVSIASPYPTALRGRLVLRFTPDPGLNVDDPAVAFVDGSRAMTFEIPAGATEAVFPVPQNALQTGSVAGVIELEVTLASGDFDVTPTPAPVKAVRVDRTAPVITSVRVAQTTGGFEVIVVGLSTTREVTGATFQFTPAADSRLDASQVTVSTEAAARQWFADGQSRQFGGQFTFTQPFTVHNVTLFEVTVTLTNGQGTSQPARARF